MNVELVETWTSDGVRLHGALQLPAAVVDESTRVDAMLLSSGVGGNFYGSSLMASLSDMCTTSGIAALHINTRGHDTVNTVATRNGQRCEGAAFEIVDDCRYDFKAWIDFIVARGFQRVGLLGHSLGAIKALYSQAHEPHDAVTALTAVSPPRLRHEEFRLGDQSQAFQESFESARALADSGQAVALFRATFPFPMIISAATYLDKYGPESRYDFTSFADRVRVPVLFSYGELELQDGRPEFEGLADMVPSLNWSVPPRVITIPGANHFYTDCFPQLSQAVKRFVM